MLCVAVRVCADAKAALREAAPATEKVRKHCVIDRAMCVVNAMCGLARVC
jgi:hypothetical protein